MRTALVLDGRSGQALAVVRSLGRAGWRVLAEEDTRCARSRYAADVHQVPGATGDAGDCRRQLVAALARDRIDVLVPCTDASMQLVWELGEELGDTRVLGADRRSWELARDKRRTLAAADRCGFPTPTWFVPENAEQAVRDVDRVGRPCVVKPRCSYTPAGIGLAQRRHRIVEDIRELRDAVRELAEPDGGLPIVQAFAPGRSLAVSAVLYEGRVLAFGAREALSFLPVQGGSPVWKRTIAPDEVGVRAVLDLLVCVGYEGLVNVEYQVDAAGVPRLMEFSGRAHVSVPLFAAAGLDLPLIAAHALVGERPPVGHAYRVGVEMRWPGGELRRLPAALGDAGALPPGVRRRDVLLAAWPPWRPGMHYDQVARDDLRTLVPAGIERLLPRRR